jgi:very-short-patch-repair endonuclease
MVSLERHQQWRKAGLPTISVLCGASGSCLQEARRWAQEQGRGVALVAGDGLALETIASAWIDALASSRDLAQDAAGWLARHLDRPVDELGPALARKMQYELDTFVATALPEESPTATVCRWLLEQATVAAPGNLPTERVVAGLLALIPQKSAPILLLVPSPESRDEAAWIGCVALSLARLAEIGPALPLLLMVEPEALCRYRSQAPESRAKALIRSGVIRVATLDGLEISHRLERAVPGAAAVLAGSIYRLVRDGVSDRLASLFVEAASANLTATPETEPSGHARSAAERFLFERLDSLPQTSGRFTLNAQLPFAFGNGRAIEVDLAAPQLALAVEIDGYYHFRDADAYRRDRRKDIKLQRHGYLVVRILAGDVVRRLEEVLDQILAVVDARRHQVALSKDS